MSKLTNRSQIYLKKIKAQYGDFINDSVHYLQNPAKKQETQEDKGFSLADNLPVIGAGLQVLGGIKSLFESDEQRRIQQTYEREYAKDLKERKEQSRANSFYLTPYTTNRTSNLTAKKGMQIPVPFYQNGGQMDLFMDFYNQQEQSKKQTIAYLTDTYADKNEQRRQKVDQMKSQGLSDLIGGAAGIASIFQKGGITQERLVKPKSINYGVSPIPAAQIRAANVAGSYDTTSSVVGINFGKGNNKVKSKDRFRMKQEGGELEGIPESEDLYSENFVSPYEIKEQVENELKTESPGEELQYNAGLMNWLFEEEPIQTHTISDIYDSKYSTSDSHSNENMPISPVLNTLSQLGLKPSSVNTGEHSPNSKHYHNEAVDLGLNTTFGGDQKKMDAFYQYLQSPEGQRMFPNIKVRDERARPQGQKVWSGSHLHLEVID